jgi:hypothetical protein
MKLTEYTKAKGLFTNFFDLRLSDFYEQEMSVGFQRIQIDIVRFDAWLHQQHGDYESMGYSLKTLLINKYSEQAFKFLDSIS